MTRALKHLAAFSAYVILALLFTWPMPLHFSTHFLGQRGDDTGIIIWDMWYFRYALTTMKNSPLWTDLVYWPFGGNLLLTNYTLFNNAIAFFLAPQVGMAAAWNAIFIASAAASAYGTMLMLLDWGFAWGPAFVSGALFAFSPTLTMQTEWGRGLEFACLNAIPFFFWSFSRAIRDGKLRDAALASLCLTWAWSYNYYYFMICGLLVPFCYATLSRPIQLDVVRRAAGARRAGIARATEAALALALAWVLYSIFWKGQKAFRGQGSAMDLLKYVSPYLCFWSLAGLRLAIEFSPTWHLNRAAWRWRELRPYAATLGFWTALNLPMIAAIFYFMTTGDYGTTSKAWRGGGDPVDPVWLAIPSLFHPLWSGWVFQWLKSLPLGAPTTVSLGIIPLASALWLWTLRPRDRWVSLWFSGFVFCAVMTLGPWLKLFGIHTYLPLPFYGLHLLPVYNNFSNGTSFAVFAMLFLALLFAVALTELIKRLPPRAAAAAPAAALLLLALEFAPGWRPVFQLEFSPLIHRFADRPDGAFLPIPVSVHFPRLMYGMLGDNWLEMTAQTIHHKPRIGGFLPRVAKRVQRNFEQDEFFQALLSAQEGGGPAPILRDPARAGKYFRDMRLTYVLTESSRVPPELSKAMALWPMKLIDADGAMKLYAITR